MMSERITENVDVRGLSFPLPTLRINRAMAGIKPGEAVKMLSTVPHSIKDMKAFCARTGNELIHIDEEDGAFAFVVKKS